MKNGFSLGGGREEERKRLGLPLDLFMGVRQMQIGISNKPHCISLQDSFLRLFFLHVSKFSIGILEPKPAALISGIPYQILKLEPRIPVFMVLFSEISYQILESDTRVSKFSFLPSIFFFSFLSLKLRVLMCSFTTLRESFFIDL